MSDDLSGDMLAPSWPNLVIYRKSICIMYITFMEEMLICRMGHVSRSKVHCNSAVDQPNKYKDIEITP